MWKARHRENYPIKIKFRAVNEGERMMRGAMSGRAVETGVTSKAKSMFVRDATRLWNKVPPSVTNTKTM